MDMQLLKPAVLVVDDEESNRDILKDLLADEGYAVLSAANGTEALKLLNPDIGIVLLDLMMPDMDGIEACRRISADPRFSFIPILMLSACREDHQTRAAMDAGAIDFLSKPVRAMDLRTKVAAASLLPRIPRGPQRQRIYLDLVEFEAIRQRADEQESQRLFLEATML
ncbi:MAG: response regulator [Planctomycetota bacterium]|nr:response regulator [Planctomycetota bacterium]